MSLGSRFSRRAFLGSVGAAGASAALPSGAATPGVSTVGAAGAPGAPAGVFTCGVASGDVRPDGAVLWTRANPAPGTTELPVAWQVAATPDFSPVLQSGSAQARAAGDFTVKVAVSGLLPDRHYFYRFAARGAYSPIGRTRTAPAAGSAPSRLRFATATCQSWQMGYFSALRGIAGEEVDFVVHLGDYFYEKGGVGIRLDPVGESKTLAAYRAKFRLYRSDPDHLAMLANHPLLPIWDDHEVQDNYNRTTDPARRVQAYQAWFEYMPVVPPAAEPTRTHRSLPWGGLADLFFLDGRQYRDPQAPSGFTTVEPAKQMAAPGRSLLGAAQKQWLEDGLRASSAAWRLLANPVMLMPYRLVDLDTPEARSLFPDLTPNAGLYRFDDTWDGYQAERRELLRYLATEGIEDVVAFTGDDHCFWAGSLRPDYDDPRSPVVAHEFTIGSVSSFTDLEYLLLAGAMPSSHPGLVWHDIAHRGYAVVDVTPDSVEVTCKFVDPMQPEAAPWDGARFRVRRGSRTIERL